jgi:Gpi18-like mannosyltransferase
LVKAEGTAVRFSLEKRELAVLALLLLVSFIVRLLLFPAKGYILDTQDFTSWFNTAAQHGIRPFYNLTWSDYPPFNVYIFWVGGTLANVVSKIGISVVDIIKLIPNLFDLATALLIFFFVRRQSSFKLALAATAFYTFNPAVIYNAAVWGQFDAIYTFFLILSLMLALRSKPKLASAAYAIAILTKPQGIALAPLIILLIYKKNGLKNLLLSVATFVATVFVVILPFEWSSPTTFLYNIYFGAYAEYKVTSANAFNLWSFYPGLWASDANFFLLGWVLFGVLAAFVCYVAYKRLDKSGDYLAVFCAFMLFFGFFMLPTRIHERYLFPAISVLALMVPFVKRARLLYVVLTGTLLINQASVLYYLNQYYPNPSPNLTGNTVVVAVSTINLMMLAYASFVLWSKRTWLKNDQKAPSGVVKGDLPPPP